MALLLALLTSVATLATAAAPVARLDSAAAVACPALVQAAHEQPLAAGDVRAALAAHGGVVVRWEATTGPIRVWVQPRTASTVDWDRPPAAWRDAVLGAARAWRGIVPGLEFRDVADSTGADVIVTWADEHSLSMSTSPGLATGTAGRTELFDTGGRATTAHVRLALTSADGASFGIADVRTVARHEFGHVLGLAHHVTARSVMAARVRSDRLQPGDEAALRLLYSLPAGARCDATPRVADQPRQAPR
jgi:predicted Zn-dependent protease